MGWRISMIFMMMMLLFSNWKVCCSSRYRVRANRGGMVVSQRMNSWRSHFQIALRFFG